MDKANANMFSGKSEFIDKLSVSNISELRSDASRPNATSAIVADWKFMESYLGCAGRELNQQDYQIITALFRSYFGRGIAPSISLVPTFKTVSSLAARENWTLVDLPPGVVNVFNRLLATSEEMEEKRNSDLQKQRAISSPQHNDNKNGSNVIDLGREEFAIGTFNQLKLFERGCHIKTKEHNIVTIWEDIASVSYKYLSKHTLNAFTTKKEFLFVFELRNGTSIPITLLRMGGLWGFDFIYHNYKINKLIDVLSQHTTIAKPPRGWLLQ